MKKSVPLLLLVLLSNVCCSQEYKRLRLTAGVGILPLIFIEPSFRINDKFSVGVKWESGNNSNIVDYDYKTWSITSQYYLSQKEALRPFIGLGVGYYSLGDWESGTDQICSTFYHNSQVGFFPRVGLDSRRLSVALDLNLIGTISYTLVCQSKATEGSSKMHFFALKAGFTIGSGKRILSKK